MRSVLQYLAVSTFCLAFFLAGVDRAYAVAPQTLEHINGIHIHVTDANSGRPFLDGDARLTAPGTAVRNVIQVPYVSYCQLNPAVPPPPLPQVFGATAEVWYVFPAYVRIRVYLRHPDQNQPGTTCRNAVPVVDEEAVTFLVPLAELANGGSFTRAQPDFIVTVTRSTAIHALLYH